MSTTSRCPSPRSSWTAKPALVAAIGAGIACVGSIRKGGGENGFATAPDTGGMTAAAGSGGQGGSAPTCAVAPAPLRRLTQREYENTLRQLKVLRPGQPLPFSIADEPRAGFAANSGDPISPDAVAQYNASAHRLAAGANLADILACEPALTGEDACAHEFIETFGRRAYRRPLDDFEHSALFDKVYRRKKAVSSFEGGVKLMLEAMLQSPQFLYRAEGVVVDAGHAALFPLSGYELATRLSYFLWASTPDEGLLAAAAANDLATPPGIERQARRMIADPRFSEALTSFYSQWLGLDKLDDVAGSKKGLPLFTAEMRDAARDETLRFVDFVLREGGGKLETLFSARFSFLSPATAKDIYSFPLPVTGKLQRVDFLPPLDRQRAGLLTQISLLSTLATSNQTSPIRRGVFVRTHLLCRDLAPPPVALVKMGKTQPPQIDSSLTTRQRFERHSSDPVCAGCHSLIDPIGFGFENYDTHGIYLSRENTNASRIGEPPVFKDIDATFELTGTTIDGKGRGAGGKYEGVVDFTDRLATSKDLRDCIAEQYLRFVLARAVDKGGDDGCVLEDLGRAFAANDYRIPDLLVAVAMSDAFRFVKAE